MASLKPIDFMFLGPVYRIKPADVRAAVDRLLSIEPGHRDSGQIVVGYCRATDEIRDQIDNLLQIIPRDGGYEVL